MSEKKGSKGKIILIAVVIFLGIGIISGVIHNLTGTTKDDTSKSEKPNTNTSAGNDANLKDKVENADSNTSAMVDKIALQAKEDASSIDEEKTNEAVTFIRDTYPDYFIDNDTMEKTMYYGYLLEYAYKDTDNSTLMNLGMDTYQAVKYVYRGAESVEDDATQENLRQISESLDKLK